MDDLQVAGLGGLRVVAVEELLYLALGDGIGGLGEDAGIGKSILIVFYTEGIPPLLHSKQGHGD